MTVVDIHTHMITDRWVDQIRKHGAPDIAIGRRPDGVEALVEGGSLTMPLIPEMFDLDLRIRDMDKAGIDVGVLSLTSPNVYWGDEAVSAETARAMNEGMKEAQTAQPDRIRFFASLPWRYPDAALAELNRACDDGAVGVVVLANIRGVALDGFFDRFPRLNVIAAHGGGTLPFLASRIELFFHDTPKERRRIAEPPSAYLRRIYYDGVLYDPESLALCLKLAGPDRIMFGTDYPHATDIPALQGCARALPPAQGSALLGGNAVRLFGL